MQRPSAPPEHRRKQPLPWWRAGARDAPGNWRRGMINWGELPWLCWFGVLSWGDMAGESGTSRRCWAWSLLRGRSLVKPDLICNFGEYVHGLRYTHTHTQLYAHTPVYTQASRCTHLYSHAHVYTVTWVIHVSSGGQHSCWHTHSHGLRRFINLMDLVTVPSCSEAPPSALVRGEKHW